MSYGPHRLNRPGLRPQFLRRNKNKPADPPANEVQSDLLPGDPASPNTHGSDTHSRGLLIQRNRALSRPAVRQFAGEIAAPASSDGLAETWNNSYIEAESPARLWGVGLVVFITVVWGIGFLAGFQVSLVILMAAGLILSIFGLLSPSLGILAIGMVAALDAMANIFLLTGGVLRYNTLNYWLLIVMLIYIPFILRLRDLNSRTLQIFLLLLTLELTFSTDKGTGIQDILNIGVTFGMVVYFARALKDELALYWLGIVNGVLAGLGGLVFSLQMDNLPYANPNDWTYFQLTALFSICVSYPFAIKYHKGRLILLLLAAVNIVWVFLSGSRGSLLIAALCAAYLFLSTRSLTWKSVMIVVAVLIAGWVSIAFADQQITTISRIQLLFDPNVAAIKRTSKRSLIAEAGLRIFQQNPMGIGTGSFAEESINTGLLGSQRPAHSAWIKVLAENGVLGILLLTVFIGSYAIVGFRKHQEGKLLFALFITLVFASAFVAKEFRGKSLWFLAASGIVLLHPEEILAYVQQKLKPVSTDYRQRLREVRFGRKR